MRFFSFFERSTRAFHHSPTYSKLIVLFTVSGGGLVAYSESKSDNGAYNVVSSQADAKKKKVVVLGTGWAGTSFLKNLNGSLYDVQVVSPRNYFAFTPLLPSVTCGTVEARSIVEPIRKIIKKKTGNIEFCEAECVKIDAANKKVHCRSTLPDGRKEFLVDYDYLVIAMGAQANTFNTPGVPEHCHFLKEVEDAQRIRRSVIDCFEKASLPNLSDEERKKMLHFVIVGGGPTGVEFAAELHDFVCEDLEKLYPDLQDLVKIYLIEAGDQILNMFDKRISSFAVEKFGRDGIDVKTGYQVVSVSDKAITMKVRPSGEITSLPYGMVLWSTGIGTRPVIMDFMKQIGQMNRRVLATDEWLRVLGCDDVYALGDCATIQQRKVMEDISAIFNLADKDKSGTLTIEELQDVIDDICLRYPQVELYLKAKQMRNAVDLLIEYKGKETKEVDIEGFKIALSQVDSQMKNLPATAQVAAQEGAYLAKCFNNMEESEHNPEGPPRIRGSGRHRFRPFRYKHLGQFAPLGGEQTAAQLPGDWISIGHSSQWLWYSVYASKQVSWRTRILVISNWTWRFIFGRDSSGI
ncbi:external alternative NAD(P)H-ubiquinone oxidoreductase B2, mitochondrial-like [Magnolia sinica]|uniref:external alternative NAD(P)H-ubiquinone oxidoreductase B2, mitochondrial-like n=1 Tax=Magnolia sinica TaxID=86752 RepID=UPI002657EA9B|nr:external alternative NAD(P)H-ubiquinone oxidoreductase B2, mitochondrial-like [Magnolia sinica]